MYPSCLKLYEREIPSNDPHYAKRASKYGPSMPSIGQAFRQFSYQGRHLQHDQKVRVWL